MTFLQRSRSNVLGVSTEGTRPVEDPAVVPWMSCCPTDWALEAGDVRIPLPWVHLLADDLVALKEPWRGRFLHLVAGVATRWSWGDGRPSYGQLTTWLAYPAVYRFVRRVLVRWRGTDAIPPL